MLGSQSHGEAKGWRGRAEKWTGDEKDRWMESGRGKTVDSSVK